jgi:hypothetical protein
MRGALHHMPRTGRQAPRTGTGRPPAANAVWTECDSRRVGCGRISRYALKRLADSDDVDRRGEREREAWTPAGAAAALRLALRLQTHGEPDVDAFTACSKRPSASDHVDRRERCPKGQRGHPPAPRMLCGWRGGARLGEVYTGAFLYMLEVAEELRAAPPSRFVAKEPRIVGSPKGYDPNTFSRRQLLILELSP